MKDKITDKIVEQVITKYKKRSQLGIEKYGTTLEDNKLSMEEWLTHLQEELMDSVVYIEKIKQEIKCSELDSLFDFLDDLKND
jgi:phosphoglucomutase